MKTIRNTTGYLLAAMMLFLPTGCAIVDMEVGASATKAANNIEVYIPPITAYIFPEAMPTDLPLKCSTETCDFDSERFSTPEEVVEAIFANGQGSSNYFTKQIMVANRVSINDVQIVYVKTDTTVTSTTSFIALDSQTFTLTDSLGVADKGTINHEENRIRLVFTGSFTCGPVSAAGCASVNDQVSIQTPHLGLIVMNMNGFSLRTISETVAHELGHFFGLLHTFAATPTTGCETIAQGSSNYIMDYSSNATLFQECEINHSKTILEASPFSKGVYQENPVTSSPMLFTLNSNDEKTQLEQRIQVLKGDWEGKRTIGRPLDLSGLNFDIPFMP